MLRLGRLSLALLVVSVSAHAAWAQGRGGRGMGGDSLFLLSQKSVQDELKLEGEQIAKAAQLSATREAARQGAQNLTREERRKQFEEQSEANNKAVAEFLNADQAKRLRQISLQQLGARAFEDPEVADALILTDEQKGRITTIQEDARTQMRSLFQGGNREQAAGQFDALRRATTQKVTDLLTAEQKTKWKELIGEQFTGYLQFPQRGRN